MVNQKNGKSYIGSSKNIIRRWYIHKSALKNNRHHCIYLQRSWNKHGEAAFKFEVIKSMDHPTEEQLLAEELKVINERLPEYNVGTVGGGDNLTNNPNREDIIRRITAAVRERVSNMSDEERKRIWSRPMDKNPNWKGGTSIYHCVDCGNEIAYYAKRCLVCSKQGNLNSFYGKHHSDKTRNHLSKIRQGKLPTNSLRVIINGIEYASFNIAAKAYNVTGATISNWLKGRKPHHKKIIISLPHT